MHFHEPNSGLLGQTERSLNWSRINKETLIVTYQAFHDWSVTKLTLNCLDEIDPFIQSCIEMNFANKMLRNLCSHCVSFHLDLDETFTNIGSKIKKLLQRAHGILNDQCNDEDIYDVFCHDLICRSVTVNS